MLTIDVELLTGRYVATSHHDRDVAEWPPHPARLFSALVAALHERDPVDADERAALEWLEKQPPPCLDVDLSIDDESGRRSVMDVFVPVNDVSLVGDIEAPLRAARELMQGLERQPPSGERDRRLKEARKEVEKETKKLSRALAALNRIDEDPSDKDLAAAVALLPDRRVRQVRTFPIVCPARPHFAFSWPVDAPSAMRTALDSLSKRVTRLGHSSSLVRCSVLDKPITPTLVPSPDGNRVLRVIGPGQLERLEAAHARHRGIDPRVLPARPQRYRVAAEPAREAVHQMGTFCDDWIVFERVDGARPLSSRGTDVARALRAALLEQHGSRTLPASLSGHREDGAAADVPHIAFVSLPFVGNVHADASIQGCAIVLPRNLGSEDRRTLLRLVAAWERDRSNEEGRLALATGNLPPVIVQRIEVPTKATLRTATWCRPSRRFVTATPIALDRNPGNLRSNVDGTAKKAAIEAQRLIADACIRGGFPAPVAIEISSGPLLVGAQPVRSFLPWPRSSGRHPRVRVHAAIEFAADVVGPMLLGAGRYFGLGLCLPVQGGDV